MKDAVEQCVASNISLRRRNKKSATVITKKLGTVVTNNTTHCKMNVSSINRNFGLDT